MPPTILALLDQLEAAGATVGNAPALENVRAIRRHSGSARLQLLVAGSTGAGRASLVNALLGAPVLPASPLPKAPIGLTLRYGPALTVETVDADGIHTALPAESLRSVLIGPNAGRAAHLDIQAPIPALQTCDIHIAALEAGYSPEHWRELRTAADYIFLVLNANALLSSSEREFIKQLAASDAAEAPLQRVAVIVNQMDRVPEEERAALLDLVYTFLGPFQSQPMILDLSAPDRWEPDEPPRAPAAETLRTLLHDLVEQHAFLRASALREALVAVVAELSEVAAGQQAFLALNRDEVAELRETIAARQEWLQGRIQRTQRRAHAFIGTLIKDGLLRDIESFGQMFRTRLPGEIEAIADLAVIKRHLPGYLETVWEEFLQERMIAIRSKLATEAMGLNRLIETDLDELLEGRVGRVGATLGVFDPSEESIPTFVMPKRGKHRASEVARGLSVQGYFMLFFDLPTGVLTLALSHLLQQVNRSGIESAEKEAIAAAAANAVRDVEEGLRRRIGEEFAFLARQIEGEVATVYRKALARIEELLSEAELRDQGVEARRQEIDRLLAEVLPQARRSLEELAGAEGTRVAV